MIMHMIYAISVIRQALRGMRGQTCACESMHIFMQWHANHANFCIMACTWHAPIGLACAWGVGATQTGVAGIFWKSRIVAVPQ